MGRMMNSEDNGMEYGDGPWAEGWDKRSGNSSGLIDGLWTYYLDRYRNGLKMAMGVKLEAVSEEDALRQAYDMMENTSKTVFKFRKKKRT